MKEPAHIGHVAISASAGSGKTFQLAHRYIRLLANEVHPDRINALTFSRKAAGEMFDAIMEHLVAAVMNEKDTREKAALIAREDFGRDEFRNLLRLLVDNLHRLHISTLDAFMISIVRSFPSELGMPMDVRITEAQGADAQHMRERVLDHLFEQSSRQPDDLRRMLEAYKLATFGQEDKSPAFDTFVEQFREKYLVLPHEQAWGDEEQIWSAPCPWPSPAGNMAKQAAQASTAIDAAGFKPGMQKALLEVVAFLGNFTPTSRSNPGLYRKTVFARLLEQMDDVRSGTCEITYSRATYTLGPGICRPLAALLENLMHIECTRALRQTRGLFRILDTYEHAYDRIMRHTGTLTFTDAQYLLTPANAVSDQMLSRESGLDKRLYIDYRLDCKLDHWLLDEFQDTSDLQWSVLSNLVDEIVQDAEGQRTFFYVGDVKQAIYAWRGGNARLFNAILKQYGSRIEQQPLNRSFRSCEPVIHTVNRVFGNLSEHPFPEETIANWSETWAEHSCSDKVPDQGCVMLLEPPYDGSDKPTAEDRHRAVADLLNEIRPGERSLSTAVLVKTNDQGKAVVDLLRRSCPGMTIVHEGKAPILDNPVVQTLLALIKVAAHPGDRFAWRQVQMSPLGSVVTVAGFTRKTCSLRLLRELRRDGFQAFVRHWGEELNKAAVLDAFGRKRLDDLAAAGGMYDATGESECNRFLRFIEHHQTSEQGDDDVVRVMTVHQSKGLGFDIVILPELMKESMVKSSRIDMLTRRDETTGQPEWILQAPPRTLAEVDDVLSAAYEQEDARDAFESLCALYVAMTRAKRGLYLITSFPGKSSKTFNEATLVKEALVGNAGETDGKEITINGQPYALLYEEGTPEWFTAFKTRTHSGKTEPHHELPADFGDRPSRRKRLARISPSLRAESPEPASLLFEDIGHRTRQLGTAVHALLERVGWIDDLDLDALLEEWKTIDAYSDEEKALAAEHARHVLTTESCRKALERPSADAELWRERMFEIVLDDDWVTGAFDRVVLLREPGGEITGATILDYKSNRVEDNKEMRKQADKYRPQLELYRDVLARMLAIDPSSITLQLLFTWPAEVVTL